VIRESGNDAKDYNEVGSETSGLNRRRESRTVFHALAAPVMEILFADWEFFRRLPGVSS
jgi:hypothetical protein